MKRILLISGLSLIYAMLIPEIIFRFIPESIYMILGKLVNPLHIFPSTIDALIIAVILFSLFFAWATVRLIIFIKNKMEHNKMKR